MARWAAPPLCLNRTGGHLSWGGMVRFDLFDVEIYDAVLGRIGGDCDQCEVPHIPFLRRL